MTSSRSGLHTPLVHYPCLVKDETSGVKSRDSSLNTMFTHAIVEVHFLRSPCIYTKCYILSSLKAFQCSLLESEGCYKVSFLPVLFVELCIQQHSSSYKSCETTVPWFKFWLFSLGSLCSLGHKDMTKLN